ncbi:hypothetical protein [Acidovorax sp. SDU_ACID1]|uniref:hypothetical protein n=1 Tax=Acidovorax sp. SDU_ACID1 TaxID=3136632 RepID=UPI00387358D7
MSTRAIPIGSLSFWEVTKNMLFPMAGNPPPQEQQKPSPPGKKEEEEQQQQISALRHTVMAREIYG